MSCGGRLKDNEIFNEITNASDEDNCSENESKNHNSLRKKNISARTNVLKNKGCQSESSSDTEYSKIKLTKETQQNEGKLGEIVMEQVNTVKQRIIHEERHLHRGTISQEINGRISTTNISKKDGSGKNSLATIDAVDDEDTVNDCNAKKCILSGTFNSNPKVLTENQTQNDDDTKDIEKDRSVILSKIFGSPTVKDKKNSNNRIKSELISKKTKTISDTNQKEEFLYNRLLKNSGHRKLIENIIKKQRSLIKGRVKSGKMWKEACVTNWMDAHTNDNLNCSPRKINCRSDISCNESKNNARRLSSVHQTYAAIGNDNGISSSSQKTGSSVDARERIEFKKHNIEEDFNISDCNLDTIYSISRKHKFSLSSSSDDENETNQDKSGKQSVNPSCKRGTFKKNPRVMSSFLGGVPDLCEVRANSDSYEVSDKKLVNSTVISPYTENVICSTKHEVQKFPSHLRFLSSSSDDETEASRNKIGVKSLNPSHKGRINKKSHQVKSPSFGSLPDLWKACAKLNSDEVSDQRSINLTDSSSSPENSHSCNRYSTKHGVLKNPSHIRFLSSSSEDEIEANQNKSSGKSQNPSHKISTTRKILEDKSSFLGGMSDMSRARAKLDSEEILDKRSISLTDVSSSSENDYSCARYSKKHDVLKNPSHIRFLSSSSEDESDIIEQKSFDFEANQNKSGGLKGKPSFLEGMSGMYRVRDKLGSDEIFEKRSISMTDVSSSSENSCPRYSTKLEVLKNPSHKRFLSISSYNENESIKNKKVQKYKHVLSLSDLSDNKIDEVIEDNVENPSMKTICSANQTMTKKKRISNQKMKLYSHEMRTDVGHVNAKSSVGSPTLKKYRYSTPKKEQNLNSSDEENIYIETNRVSSEGTQSSTITGNSMNNTVCRNINSLDPNVSSSPQLAYFAYNSKEEIEPIQNNKVQENKHMFLSSDSSGNKIEISEDNFVKHFSVNINNITSKNSAEKKNLKVKLCNLEVLPNILNIDAELDEMGSVSDNASIDKSSFSISSDDKVICPKLSFNLKYSSDAKKHTPKKNVKDWRLIRKRKAQKGDSDAKPSKISCDSHRSTFIESPKASTPKRENRSEDDLPNEVYYPSKSSSPTKSSAKKNLFSYRNKSSEVLKGFKINLIDCQSPTKQNKDSQNDKENKAHSSTKKKFGKNDKTPNKKLVSGDNLKSEKDIKTESPIENKLTPLKQTETPTKQSSIGLHGTYERGSRTPSKNKVGSTYFKGLEESKISNELSPTKRSCETLSPSKNVSKPNSDAKSNDLYSKTKTPQKQIKNYTERELQRLNIDCNPSVYEVPSPVRKNKSSFSKTTTPLKHEDNENVINTPKKSLRKDFKKEIENYETECLTSCKNEFQSSGVKGSSLSSAVKHEVRKQNVMSPLQRKEITVTTPVSKKKSGRGFLTPSMMKKEHVNTNGKTNDDLDTTRKQLHISTVPKSLPCRDAEFDQIKSFLIRKIEHCAGGCMYISGVPGTGKTATVHAVVRSLQLEADSGDLPDFDFVEVNGLRLTEPKQAYVRILQTLTDKKLSPDQAQQLLNKRFSGSCKKSTIILVDELDYLCNRRQDVVYNILDWPTKQGSGLVVLTISNTMDLPERTLKGRVTSRMGLTRVTFQPYSHHQLKTIVEDRLSGTNTFHPDAVQLVARKVAAVSGDARRALDICRRTTEQVMHGEQVTVSHVERALTQIFSGPRVSVIQSLCREGQLVLRAIRDVNQRTGVDEATVTQVYKHLWEICLVDGCPRPTVGGMLQTCVSLVALGLIVAEKGRVDITRKMSLNVSSDDIHFALDNIKV